MTPTAPPTATGPRPTAVTIACYLIYTFAAAAAVEVLIKAAFTNNLRPAGVPPAAPGAAAVGTIVGLAIAAGIAALGYRCAKGGNVARIITWIVLGVLLCASALSTAAIVDGALGGVLSDLPGWYLLTTAAIQAIYLLTAIPTVILLALPASNAYFRKPAL
jgi:hypothetical protein